MERATIKGTPVNLMGCCGIFAAATALGKNVEHVFNDYKDRYNKRANWKGSTYRRELIKMIEEDYGHDCELVYDYTEDRPKTVAKFAETVDRDDVYLVYIRGHVMLLNKGRLVDQNHDCDMFRMRYAGRTLEYAYKIPTAPRLPDHPVSGELTDAERNKVFFEKKVDEAVDLIKAAERHGIDVKKKVRIDGIEWEVIGYKKRNRRYPFILRANTGKTAKASINFIKNKMEAA
jgi:hypothetical protein